MAIRKLQFDRQCGLNRLHKSLIEPKKIVCKDMDCTFWCCSSISVLSTSIGSFTRILVILAALGL